MNIEEAFEDFSDLVRMLIPAEYISVVRIRDDDTSIRSPFIAGDIVRRDPVDLASSIGGRLAREKKSFLVNLETQDDADQLVASMPATEFDVSHGFRSILSVPLMVGESCVGAIHLRDSALGKFTSEHIEIAEQIATYVAPAVVNAGLHYEIQRESEVQELLVKMSRLMSSTVSLDKIVPEIRELVNSILPADRLVISTLDESTGTGIDTHTDGVTIPDQAPTVGVDTRTSGNVQSTADRVVSIMSTEDIDAATEESDRGAYLTRQAGLRSAMYAPLVSDGQLIGTINVKSTWPHAYGEPERAAFAQIAQQIVGSVAASQYAAALRSEITVQEVLAELSRTMASASSLDDVFEDVCELLGTIVPIDRLVVAPAQEDPNEFRDSHVYGVPVPGWDDTSDDRPRGNAPTKVIKDLRMVVTPTEVLDRLELEKDGGIFYTKAAGLRSAIYAPLIVEGNLIGTLNAKSKTPNAYGEREQSVFELIAQQLASSLGTSIFGDALKDEVQRQEALADLGRVITSSRNLNSAFDEIGQVISRIVTCDTIFISSMVPDSNLARIRLNWGDSTPRAQVGSDYPLDRTQIEYVLDSGKPLCIGERNLDELAQKIPRLVVDIEHGLRSQITVPLISNGIGIGILGIRSRTSDAYQSHHVALVSLIAGHIAGAVEKDELTYQAQQNSKENEALAELGRVMDASNDLDDVWTDAAGILGRMIESDRITLAYKNEADNDRIQILTQGVELPESLFDVTLPIYSELLDSPVAPFILEDSEYQQSEIAREVERMTRSAGLNSTLFAPVVRRDKVVALLTFRSKSIDAFSLSDVRIAGMITNQISGAVVNSQSFRAIEQAAGTRDALSELGRILSHSLDLEDLFEQLGTQIQKLIQVDRLTLAYLTDEDRSLELRYIFGKQLDNLPTGWKLGLPEGAGEMFRGLREHLLVDEETCQTYPWLEPVRLSTIENGLPTLLFCPVVWQDEVIALLTFRSSYEDAYDDSDLQNATLIADRISGSVASLETYQATKRESEVRQALAEISVLASQDLNLESAGNRIAEGIRTLLPFDRFSIATFVPETQHRILEYYEGIALEDDFFGKDLGKLDIADDWSCEDFSVTNARWSDRDDELHTLGLNSMLAMPIGVERSAPSGLITIWSKSTNSYTVDDQKIFQQIAAHITPAIQNAKFYEQSTLLARHREQSLELDQENKELQRIADARSEFLSTVSHELRTPLTAISAFADILRRNGSQNLTQRQMDQLDVVRRSSSNLAELIDDLLDVSRSDGGRIHAV
ncbi:GAF domain-containing protein [Candidatus Lucifugimonas marina]|uniref:GAF domain-containing protein n=1 Tax=Candidatus Lucifugimonas marina TaxID=3038979 RepID=UPI0027A6853A|nr:GAF domain-containing protein [SAR202 cluster bacterium JH545]